MDNGWGPGLFQIRAVRDLLWILVGIACFYLLFHLRDVFFPVFFALVLAYLSNPLIRRAKERWFWPRWFTAFLMISLFFLGMVGVVLGIWPTATEQFLTLNKRIPDYMQILTKRLEKAGLDNWQNEISKFIGSFDTSTDMVGTIMLKANQTFDFLGNLLGGATYLGLLLALIPVFYFYFAMNFETFLVQAKEWIPYKNRDRILDILGKMDSQVLVFFRGRLVVAVFMCVMFALGWLATGVPYWFILGIGAGLLSMAPYVSGVFLPAAILLKYMETLDPNSGETATFTAIVVWPSVVFFVVQFIEGWLLTPWIQSRDNELSVPTVLIVIYIGGVVGGFWGLMFAIPIAACIKILFQEFILPKLRVWVLRH